MKEKYQTLLNAAHSIESIKAAYIRLYDDYEAEIQKLERRIKEQNVFEASYRKQVEQAEARASALEELFNQIVAGMQAVVDGVIGICEFSKAVSDITVQAIMISTHENSWPATPPCLECGAQTKKEAETKCKCSGDKDECHGCYIWPH